MFRIRARLRARRSRLVRGRSSGSLNERAARYRGARLLALFARRELSPSEYYEHLLEHIQRWEPHLNALYRFDPQRVREQAAAATERWRKGNRGARWTDCR